MSSRRGPAAPPAIEGYQYVQHLGSGGFADVYLYEQDRPRRKVAVKVLLSDLKTDGARRRFESEANLMAQLSTHPFIVTIYEANVTASGHSYLAMEYCSKPNLDVRLRRQRFSVDDALAVGIQVASAVETAHRAGIAHRDIKPANILVTDYNRPALTDFGISGTTDAAADDDGGMSIPWSPPEAFQRSDSDGVKVDVWALGATVYTLLAGRSPFAVPGGNKSPRELMSRIASMPLPDLGRIDVPQSLQQILATAMAKQPGSRYPSAHSFALALQRVQAELSLAVTRFEVLDDGHDAEHPGDDSAEDATRIRGVVSIDPLAAATGSATAPRTTPSWPKRPGLPGPGGDTTVARRNDASTATAPPPVLPAAPMALPAPPPSAVPAAGPVTAARTGWDRPAPFTPLPVEDTQLRPAESESEPVPDSDEDSGPARRPRWLLPAAGGVLVAAAVIGLVVVNGVPTVPSAPETTAVLDGPLDPVAPGSVVPAPAKLAGTKAGGSVTFTWENPAPAEGDVYMWRAVSVMKSGEYSSTSEARAVLAASPDEQTCLEVVIRRSNGQATPEPAKACVP
jgi:serine/threonine protein kinase